MNQQMLSFWIVCCYVLFHHFASIAVSTSISCSNAYSCSPNEQLKVTAKYDKINCDGYKSCYDATEISIPAVNYTGFLYCQAASACDGSLLTRSDHIYCYGDQSCANTKNMTSLEYSATIDCFGSHSCSNIDYFNYPGISKCYGVGACSNSNIIIGAGTVQRYSYGIVQGYGAYSLMNTRIDSGTVIPDITIEYYGYYSGYNSSVMCQNDVICSIECHGNGCKYVFIECSNDNYNSIYNICINVVVNCDESNSIDCPWYINPNSTQDNSVSQMRSTLLDISEIDLYYFDILTEISDNNDICDNSNSSLLCDNEFDCDGSSSASTITFDSNVNVESSNICCRASWACKDTLGYLSGIISYEANTNILCTGGRVCHGISLISTENSDENGGGNVYCLGYLTCYGDDVTLQIKVTNQNVVYCGAYYSCNEAEIYNASSAYCTGDYSCQNSKFYGVSNIYLLAATSDSVSVANTKYIYSNGIHNTSVYIMTENGGAFTSIYCNDGTQICYIECSTYQACDSTNTKIYCENNATCLVSCNETLGITCPEMTQGTYTIVISRSNTIDTTIAPSVMPTKIPTMIPTSMPTRMPTNIPTRMPTSNPASVPTDASTLSTATTLMATATSHYIDTTESSQSSSSSLTTTFVGIRTTATRLASTFVTTNNNKLIKENGSDKNSTDVMLIVVIILGSLLLLFIICFGYIWYNLKFKTRKGGRGNNGSNLFDRFRVQSNPDTPIELSKVDPIPSSSTIGGSPSSASEKIGNNGMANNSSAQLLEIGNVKNTTGNGLEIGESHEDNVNKNNNKSRSQENEEDSGSESLYEHGQNSPHGGNNNDNNNNNNNNNDVDMITAEGDGQDNMNNDDDNDDVDDVFGDNFKQQQSGHSGHSGHMSVTSMSGESDFNIKYGGRDSNVTVGSTVDAYGGARQSHAFSDIGSDMDVISENMNDYVTNIDNIEQQAQQKQEEESMAALNAHLQSYDINELGLRSSRAEGIAMNNRQNDDIKKGIIRKGTVDSVDDVFDAPIANENDENINNDNDNNEANLLNISLTPTQQDIATSKGD